MYAVATTTITATLATASGTNSGVVEVIVPSYYSTISTAYYNGTRTSASVIYQPTGEAQGGEEIFVPFVNTFLMQINQPGSPLDGQFVHSTGGPGYLQMLPDPIGSQAQFAIGGDFRLYSVFTGNQIAIEADLLDASNNSNQALFESAIDNSTLNCDLGGIGNFGKDGVLSTVFCWSGSTGYGSSWWTSTGSNYLFLAENQTRASDGGFMNMSTVTISIVPVSDFEQNPFPGYQISTTFLPTDSAAYTSTISGNQATSATIVYATPSAGYIGQTSLWSGTTTSTSIQSQATDALLGTEIVFVPASNGFAIEIVSTGTFLAAIRPEYPLTFQSYQNGPVSVFFLNDGGNLVSSFNGNSVVLLSDWATMVGEDEDEQHPYLFDAEDADQVPALTCLLDYNNNAALSCSAASAGTSASFWLCNGESIALAVDQTTAEGGAGNICSPIVLQAVPPN